MKFATAQMAVANLLHIDSRIHAVYIFLIQLFSEQLHSLAKTLEVYDLPLPEEFDHIVYIRVIGEPEDIIISDSCLLLCCELIR